MPVVRFITSKHQWLLTRGTELYGYSCCPCHSHQKTTMKLIAIDSEWLYITSTCMVSCTANMQTGKQLNVRGEVAQFYDSNQLSTAALLRFLTAWANWSNRASVLECSHVLASISHVKIGSQYSGIKVKRHETPQRVFQVVHFMWRFHGKLITVITFEPRILVQFLHYFCSLHRVLSVGTLVWTCSAR